MSLPRCSIVFRAFSVFLGLASVATGEESSTRGSAAYSQCWTGQFSFAQCCLGAGLEGRGLPTCWDGDFNYERCCLSGPFLSAMDSEHFERQASATAPAVTGGVEDPLQCRNIGITGEGGLDWNDVRAVIALRAWSDAKPHYNRWVYNSTVQNLAACPLGVISLLLLTLHLFTLAVAGVDWARHPSFLWSEQALAKLAQLAGPGVWFRIAASGWPLLSLLGLFGRNVQESAKPHPLAAHPCDPARNLGADTAFLGGPDFAEAPEAAAASRSFFQRCGSNSSCEKGCPLDDAHRAWRAAATMAKMAQPCVNSRSFVSELLQRGCTLLQKQFDASPRPLHLLVAAEPGALTTLQRAARTLPFPLHLQSMIGHGSGVLQHSIRAHVLKAPFDRNLSFSMRLFPRSEVISDGIRHAAAPVCGLRPFISLVSAAAHAGVRARCGHSGAFSSNAACRLTVLEGGANLGSCLLWAAVALRAAGVYLLSVAMEPMEEAAKLFSTSVLDNGIAEHVFVDRRALASPAVTRTNLLYVPGRHGQASLGDHPHSGCGVGEAALSPASGCEVEQVDATTTDAAWIGRFGRSAQMDILKLNVNGEELNSLRGARRLLSRRKICVVMMHVFKAQYAIREALATLEANGVSRIAACASPPEIAPESSASATAVDTVAAAEAKVRIADASSEMFRLLVVDSRMQLSLYLEPPLALLRKNEALEIRLRSSAQLCRVLAVPGEELGEVAKSLLTHSKRSNDVAVELPFHLSSPNSQAYLVARTPQSVLNCRRTAHTLLPISERQATV